MPTPRFALTRTGRATRAATTWLRWSSPDRPVQHVCLTVRCIQSTARSHWEWRVGRCAWPAYLFFLTPFSESYAFNRPQVPSEICSFRSNCSFSFSFSASLDASLLSRIRAFDADLKKKFSSAIPRAIRSQSGTNEARRPKSRGRRSEALVSRLALVLHPTLRNSFRAPGVQSRS